MIMTSTRDLLVIFLGLEVLSVSSYALAGLRRRDAKSAEAALKYFLLGSFASAFLVLGLAFLFGAAGSLAVPEILAPFQRGGGLAPLGLFGLALVLVGFGFKIAVVPFHMWTPDVYEGAPTPVTAFFSVGPKAAGFVVFAPDLPQLLGARLRAATLVFAALWPMRPDHGRRKPRRPPPDERQAAPGLLLDRPCRLHPDRGPRRRPAGLVFYLAAYLFMSIGAFAALIGLSGRGREYLELDDFAGIGFSTPGSEARSPSFCFRWPASRRRPASWPSSTSSAPPSARA